MHEALAEELPPVVQAALSPPPISRVLPALTQVEVQPAPRRPQRKIPPEEARARFADIEEAMEQTLEEASLLEPERQRLLLLSWIATARSVEAEAASHEAYERTHAIARQCSRLAKIWWPGSVPALGLDVSPGACAGDLPGTQPHELTTWAAVAAAAEAALERLDVDGAAVGTDQHGWRDAEALAPAHAQPDALLMEVVAHLERITTSIVRPGDEGDGVPAFRAGVDPWTVDVAALAREAGKIRWLRGAASDLDLWGAAIGRLRWLAMMLRPRAESLATILNPRHRPVSTWAKDLGHDPEKRRRQKEKKALINTKGSPKPDWSSEAIRAWLHRALELGEELPNERIARVFAEEGAVEPVLAIAPADFIKRNHRTRLETIQSLLREPAQSTPVPVLATPVEDTEAEGSSYFDRLLAHVVPHTRGKRTLFVSNRNDPTIDDLVRELFLFEDVDHCEIKTSNVSAKARSIEQGSYDIVLAATGFLSHSAENVLRDAARKAQVPHVRVNRGRPLSVALALAREFGLEIPAV